jgi:hypothetical protein
VFLFPIIGQNIAVVRNALLQSYKLRGSGHNKINDNIFHSEDAMKNCSIPKKSAVPAVRNGPLSPLGWSVGIRLIWVAGAAGVLWLSVVWAIRW